VRPYIDPTITGLNEAMLPLPLHLPKVADLIPLITPGQCLAKRDWRHGFHHITLSHQTRKFMGLRLHDGTVARFKGLPFGPSQSPALFTYVANEFGRIVSHHLRHYNIFTATIVSYVDDMLIIADSFS
jgi:hypothetical protein